MASLTGIRVVVTRAAHQAEELAGPLRELGADVILLPTIGIGPPADVRPLQQAGLQANEYDWVIFTSQNGVEAFTSHWQDRGVQRFKVAAVGKATRDAAERLGFHVDLVPQTYVAESLVDAFDCIELRGKRILLPGAAVTRDVVAGDLEKRGASVTAVEAYRNVVPEEAATRAGEVFQPPMPDWVLFASPSAVDNLARIIPVEQLERVKIATIGPVTSRAVEKWGMTVAAEANPYDVRGLVAAVESFR